MHAPVLPVHKKKKIKNWSPLLWCCLIIWQAGAHTHALRLIYSLHSPCCKRWHPSEFEYFVRRWNWLWRVDGVTRLRKKKENMLKMKIWARIYAKNADERLRNSFFIDRNVNSRNDFAATIYERKMEQLKHAAWFDGNYFDFVKIRQNSIAHGMTKIHAYQGTATHSAFFLSRPKICFQSFPFGLNSSIWCSIIPKKQQQQSNKLRKPKKSKASRFQIYKPLGILRLTFELCFWHS